MNKLFEAFANIFRVPDLRKRLLFALGLLAVYRLGGHIPTPGINITRWEEFFSSNAGSIFGFFDLFAGGNIKRLTVFALGIMPYITASIILQLLTVVVPTLEKLQKEGELGRRKITQWTRYLTIILSVIQSFGIAQGLMAMQQGIVINPGIGFVCLTVISLTTGTAFIMWLGEQISERGIGNGMSLIIFTGIVVGLPNAMKNVYQNTFVTHEWSPLTLILIIAMMVLVVAFIVLVERGEHPLVDGVGVRGDEAVGRDLDDVDEGRDPLEDPRRSAVERDPEGRTHNAHGQWSTCAPQTARKTRGRAAASARPPYGGEIWARSARATPAQ